MKAQLLLEIKKNRLLFIGLAAIFWPSLALAAWSHRLSGHPAADGLAAGLTFWTLMGLPGMGLVFGASGGASLAAEPERSAEDLLPLSPRRRVFCSLAADAVHIVLLMLLVLLTAFVLSPAWRQFLVEAVPDLGLFVRTAPSNPMTRAFFQTLPFTTAYLLLLSFLFAHWTRSGMLGGILAVPAALPAAAALTYAASLNLVSDYTPFGWTGPAVQLLALGTVLLAIDRVAAWTSRQARLSARGLALALSSLLAAPALLPLLFWRSSAASQSHLILMDGWPCSVAARLLPGALEAASKGALLASPKGDVVRMTSDGRTSVLRKAPPKALLDIPKRWGETYSWEPPLCLTEDGSLWGLFRSNDPGRSFDLWHGTPESGLSRHSTLGPGLFFMLGHRGPVMGVYGWNGKGGTTFAALTPTEQRPAARADELTSLDEARGWLEAHRGAVLSPDRRRLSFVDARGRRTTWSLPGRAMRMVKAGLEDIRLPYTLGGREVFLITTELSKDKYAVVLCPPGGPARLVRQGPDALGFDALRDGTLTAWGQRNDLHVVLPDGTFLAPVSLPFTGRLLHREGLNAWLLVRGGQGVGARAPELVKLDLGSGKPLERRSFGEAHDDDEEFGTLSLVEDGFFYQQHAGRLYFLDWSGKVRDLGRP